MKKLIYAAIFIAVPFLCFSQEKVKEPIITKDKTGIIQSVEFPDGIQTSKVPSSSVAFFNDFLQVSVNDEFRKKPRKEKREEFIHEHFDQYYKGIKVDDAGFTLHYKNGKLFYANGHYVKINDLDTTPTIAPEKAKDCFANYKAFPRIQLRILLQTLSLKKFLL